MFSLSKTEKSKIIRIIKGILKVHKEISFACLHGSFNAPGPFSDIDIAVYLTRVPDFPLEYELHMEGELMGALGRYLIDVRILNNAPLSFRYNVIRYGKNLIVNNQDERADFQENTLTRFFDFAPHRNAYLKETLGLEI